MESEQPLSTTSPKDGAAVKGNRLKERLSIIRSKPLYSLAIILGVLLVSAASFAVGVNVGFHKAAFSSKWGEHYERNFLGDRGERNEKRRGPLMGEMDGRGMRNGHGVGGEVISISNDTIIIKNSDNQESAVRANEGTIINRGRNTVTLSDLQVGENVVVVGKPQEDGVIAAHLIRIFGKITQ